MLSDQIVGLTHCHDQGFDGGFTDFDQGLFGGFANGVREISQIGNQRRQRAFVANVTQRFGGADTNVLALLVRFIQHGDERFDGSGVTNFSQQYGCAPTRIVVGVMQGINEVAHGWRANVHEFQRRVAPHFVIRVMQSLDEFFDGLCHRIVNLTV